ncbi:MAG: redox-sensing transcriptional repressor Rex [Lentisphaerae bacterium]|jgi:redox-sensing transcriptional repressor|nr:redox-sensing transcriptional repressor Rex [Lentisphaerota bacterium]
MRVVPEKTVARLCLYRRILMQMLPEGRRFVRSHDIAALARVTSAQVRRDIMALGYKGLPGKGYGVQELLDSMSLFIDAPEREEVALVGVGNLGRALLAYLVGRRPNLTLRAAFDIDPAKDGLVINGCPCYNVNRMAAIIAAFKIRIAVLAVPAAVAQDVAEKLIACGVKGILNFVPVRLHVPDSVHVEDMDISSSLERVAFFARAKASVRNNASLAPDEAVDDSRL